MATKKTYISGPISGKPDGNKAAFFAEDDAILQRGEWPLNPHRIGTRIINGTWCDYMRLCVAELCRADKVRMLPGWIFSRGARWEWIIAKMLRIPIEYV